MTSASNFTGTRSFDPKNRLTHIRTDGTQLPAVALVPAVAELTAITGSDEEHPNRE